MRVPIVQGVLVAGHATQTIWVEWSTPPDSSFSRLFRPVDPAQVSLVIRTPGGGTCALGPVAGVPGRFDTSCPAAAGVTYRLDGTVAGFPVNRATTVPFPAQRAAPVNDTVQFASTVSFSRFDWKRSDAAAYALRYHPYVGGVLELTLTRDTTGTVSLPPPSVSPFTITLFAVDPAATVLFDDPARRGIAHRAGEALVLFGSGSVLTWVGVRGP